MVGCAGARVMVPTVRMTGSPPVVRWDCAGSRVMMPTVRMAGSPPVVGRGVLVPGS